MSAIEQVWITREGRLILGSGERIAMIDDRDLAECLPLLRLANKPLDDERLIEALENPQRELQLVCAGNTLSIQSLHDQDLGTALGFDPNPEAAK
jgi:hypothetical protein